MEAKTKETPAIDDNAEEGGGEEEEEEEEEEEKINAFFTLVRNIRDAHNQMLIRSQDSKEKEKAKEKETKSTWTPSFKWEDFAEDPHLRNNITTLPSSSKIGEQKRKAEEHQELDLNLSL
ncbi:protein NIM1-INTERACTING 1-like [Durio zibethinus]|uniref:Protein NIM1-INTERACTING 1-like n=1 Tax=Durio zibethinus TaxID=66656 RepID=A0A6P6AXC4_DURZI|nr:protein NIM1-INTERACTING 1-like [Durio zibethinus]